MVVEQAVNEIGLLENLLCQLEGKIPIFTVLPIMVDVFHFQTAVRNRLRWVAAVEM